MRRLLLFPAILIAFAAVVARADMLLLGVGGDMRASSGGGSCGANQTLFSSSSTPAAFGNDGLVIQTAVHFHSTANGSIVGIRFYKAPTDPATTHSVYLWDNATSTQLGTAITAGETSSGWQEADFASPITITSGTVYSASLQTTSQVYSYTQSYAFPFTSGNLVAEATNGYYQYTSSVVNPNSTFSQTNYWIDVVYSCSTGGGGGGGGTGSPPANTAVPTISPTSPVIGVAETTTNGTWSNSPTSYSYQWKWGDTGANIAGATSSTYTPVNTDLGHTLKSVVTATNAYGSSTTSSAQTSAVASSSGSTPNVPNLFSGFAKRPPWSVAGVDYYVGIPSTVTPRVPTSGNLPSGASLGGTTYFGSTFLFIDGSNVVLDGYDLTNITVYINTGAAGTLTVKNCIGNRNVNILSAVGASMSVLVQNSTLNGGGSLYASSDYQLIQVHVPQVTVEYSVIKWTPGAVYTDRGNATLRYNLIVGMGFGYPDGHANAFYIAGGPGPINMLYNTVYSDVYNAFPGNSGLVNPLAMFFDTGVAYTGGVTVDHNSIVAAFNGSGAYLIGFYPQGSSAANTSSGTFTNNYVYSNNGFGDIATHGAYGAFYSAYAPVSITASGNVDMFTGHYINLDNSQGALAP